MCNLNVLSIIDSTDGRVVKAVDLRSTGCCHPHGFDPHSVHIELSHTDSSIISMVRILAL